jgi:mRNA-degrading endonuclease RelE of RelBE toxin-antitoxin system
MPTLGDDTSSETRTRVEMSLDTADTSVRATSEAECEICRLKGRYRLRIGKWRVFFRLDQPGNVVVTDVDNRGQAY